MADAYSFALLVELEESDVPRIKNKLVKYFQSKKSNGGDCKVDYENGSRTATLRFRSEEARQNVLKRETHQISLDPGVLNVTVRLPADKATTQEASSDKLQPKSEPIIVHAPQKFLESYQERSPCLHISSNTDISQRGSAADVAVNKKQSSPDKVTPAAEVLTEEKGRDDDTPNEEPCSRMAVVGNTDKLNQEFLEMLVENVLKDPDSDSVSKSFTLEIIPYISSAVVTFQSGKDSAEFVTKCHENRTFKKKELTVHALEVTDQVWTEDIEGFSEDILRLYFENVGGDVENIVLNQEDQSAIITFRDHKVAQKVLEKKHELKQKEIKVFPFYKSLGTALYGKDKPSLKLPASFSEPIDEGLRRYLNRFQPAAATIQCALAKHFCKVNFSQSSVCLSPESSLLQQKDAKAIIQMWRDTVKSAFAQAMLKFKTLELHPESEAWQESEEEIRQMLETEDVIVMPDKASSVLLVVGLVDHVNRLEKNLTEGLNTIAKKVQREKSSVTKEMEMSTSTFHILRQDGLQDKLLLVYPELKISFRMDNSVLTLTGLDGEILAARKVIYDAMFALKRQHLEMDNFLLDLLKGEDQEELTNALLISKGINAAFEITPKTVQLLAVSDRDLKGAEEHLGRLLASEFIDVEDSDVLRKPEWQHLVSQLESANSKPCRKIRIQTTGQQVVVSGHKESVMNVSSQLNDFLTQNAHIEEIVVATYNAIVEYIKPDIQFKQVEDKVNVSYREDSICLSGSRADVADCKSLVEDLVSSVIFESFKVAKPGVKKFFKDKQNMYTASLMNETSCLVQLVDEIGVGQDDVAHRQLPKPVYQLQTLNGMEIVVCKADMCSYPVCAVVNSSNQDLNLNGGLAATLLKAAGPQLQDECDRIIKSKGQLKPGDCVITDAGGQLCCKNVIHAVGPMFDSNKQQGVLAQLKRAVKGSLKLAEENNCISVALPAISRGQGFPLNLCAGTIVKAVKDYCDEMYDCMMLESIHFVNNDDSAVQAMEAAVRKEFGNHGVSHQQTPQTNATKSPLVQQAGSSGSDPNCLGQVQTKEGLDITVMKGNIEKATTEVTVNTVFEDLALNRGAVSNAILNEAGPNLQQLVNAKEATGSFGEIVVTEGCKLKSKQVFHAVSPHWDKGKGTSEKILRGIFKHCLDKAEDTGLTSISFPAIGTGNLGFPKDLVATLMLEEILAFSSKKQPKHLKKVMIILYPGDLQTIQVFSNEFKKKFPNSTTGPVSASSPQSQGHFSKVVSSSGMHETKMGNVVIQAVTGDITKETTDVIVNSSNENFSLKSGVSKAILEGAGQAAEAECQNLAAQPNQGIILTQPGNLKCKKILHLVGQTDPVKIQKVVKDALQMCVKNTYTSVSFPAIGTGQGSVQAGQVADAMLDAVIDVLSQNTSGPLKTIRIVIFQPPMLKDFCNSMDKRVKKEVTDTEEKSGFISSLGNFGSKLISLFHRNPEKSQKAKADFLTEALKVDPACFHICGNSQTNVDSAKQWIDNLISKELHTSTIADSTILSFSKEDYEHIAEIQKTLGVSIRTEIKKGQGSVTIEGLTKDVLEAVNEINKMVRSAIDNEALQNRIELTSTVAEWQYQQQGLQFQSFDKMSNYHLEQTLQSMQSTATVKIQGQDYTVTMPSGPATDSQGRTLQIKRIDKLKDEVIPEHWDPMPHNTTCKVIPLKAGAEEYSEVLTMFQASCKRTVTKIERIQNPGMWKSLQVMMQDMEQRNGHANNMKRLFHGTSHDTLNLINMYGFNRSYAGKNAACYGNGTYFAVNASYSAGDTYSKPQNGEKVMYLCRVLTGDYTVGKQGMIAPPEKNPGSFQQYDSVVDNQTNPTMFIIFHDTHAYPEYLITFK